MLIPTAVSWQDDNDFRVERPNVGNETLVHGQRQYHNLLPNLDFDIATHRLPQGRFSYSKTIARAGYGQLARGCQPGGPGGSTLQRLHAGGNAEQPGPVAARVG